MIHVLKDFPKYWLKHGFTIYDEEKEDQVFEPGEVYVLARIGKNEWGEDLYVIYDQRIRQSAVVYYRLLEGMVNNEPGNKFSEANAASSGT